jgi:hypothetical protein
VEPGRFRYDFPPFSRGAAARCNDPAASVTTGRRQKCASTDADIIKEGPMRSPLLPFGALTIAASILGLAPHTLALADQAQPQPAARLESRLTLSIETFCSETRLRTSNARIRWGMPRAVLDGAGIAGVAAARQSLEATVYKNGFEKGLLIALPIGAATVDRPVVPLAQGRPQQPRAFQLRLIEFTPPGVQAAAGTPAEMTAVVENLEPGVNYTWRIAIDTPSGRMVSPSATAQARVCPADMAQSPAVPRRKK